MEKKTARGPKVTARISGSPRTPRVKKQTIPSSKIRRLELSPITQAGLSEGIGHTPAPPMAAIAFKKKTGKVLFVILLLKIFTNGCTCAAGT